MIAASAPPIATEASSRYMRAALEAVGGAALPRVHAPEESKGKGVYPTSVKTRPMTSLNSSS